MQVDNTKMNRLASALIASTLLAAACGSNEATEVVASTPDASVEEALATDATTAETPTTAAPTEAPTTLGDAAGNTAASSEYCEIARSLDENEAEFSIYEDPEALQTYVTSVMAEVKRMEEVAPSEIQADFAVVKSSLDTFQTLLLDADWDFATASAGMQELFEDNAEYDAASDAMDAYDRDVCGIGNSDDATTVETIEG